MTSIRLTISCLFIAAALLLGCRKNNAEKWKITLSNTDTKPYGAQLAYQSLQDFFNGVPVEALSAKTRYTNLRSRLKNASPTGNLLVFAGLDFYLSDEEWYEIANFAEQGNEVVIFCSKLDSRIEEWCQWEKDRGKEQMSDYTSDLQITNKRILQITGDTTLYGYTGRYLQGSFYSGEREQADTALNDSSALILAATDSLGYSGKRLNFIRLSTGRGHISLHAAPLALSNYFLLQGNNIQYLEGVWNTLPGHITHVYWNSYFKRLPVAPTSKTLWKFPATRNALLLALLTMAVYILFQMKRRQRIIPIIPPLKNDSVTFVETIGKLYYNKRDHTNLAEKMIQQFLEWVRLRYFLNTATLNEDFVQQLARKSGAGVSNSEHLVLMIQEIRTGKIQPDDTYLYQLHNSIQNFYKNEK